MSSEDNEMGVEETELLEAAEETEEWVEADELEPPDSTDDDEMLADEADAEEARDEELLEALSEDEEEVEEPDDDQTVKLEAAEAVDEDSARNETAEGEEGHAELMAESDASDGAGDFSAEGTELEGFESAEIEETEFLDQEQIQSIVESVLFATDKPQSVSVIKQAFKGTNVKAKDIRQALSELAASYADVTRGFELEEVNGGFQLRTKVDNMNYLKGMLKVKPFKLSGPALEVLSIVAYKQPMIKSEIDDIRGVESGHLLRALMEKRLVAFAGKTDLPGKPMSYETTRKFLEIFGLRNLKELPTLAEIDDLIPDGIGDEEEKKTLGDMTDELSEEVKAASYSEGEEELGKITDQLAGINTSSEFFEQEKARLKAKKEAEKAQDIRDAIEVGEEVAQRDRNWLEKYDQRLAEEAEAAAQQVETDAANQEGEDSSADLTEELSALSEESAQPESTEFDGDELSPENGHLESEIEESGDLAEALHPSVLAEAAGKGDQETAGDSEENEVDGDVTISDQMNDGELSADELVEQMLTADESAQENIEDESNEDGILTAEEMMEFSADPAELTDVAGEPESDLETAIERFDSEESGAAEIGSVNVEDLRADLAVFDEDESEPGV